MSKQLPTQFIFYDTSQGVINDVNYRIVPKNSVKNAVNMVFDEEYGSAKTRKGSTIIGSQLVAEDNNINGLFNFIDTAGTYQTLLAAVNDAGDGSQSIYKYSGGSWSQTLTGDTAGLKTRFETFLNVVGRVNGTDPVKTWGGSGAWITTGGAWDVANMPRGSLIKVYKDQIITAGVSGDPDTLYISSVPSSGVVSWTTNNRTITINPEDGMNITALGEINDLLIVFKDRAMYRWNNRSTEADVVINVGCSSQESVATGYGMLFFFNNKGVWVTNGDQPILISRRIEKWIDGMSASYYENVAGVCDGEFYYCSIGSSTVDGVTYSNVVLRYTLATKEWTVFSYANGFRVFSEYIDSGTYKIVGGDSTARVLQIESSALTDNGTNISFFIESHDIDFGSKGIIKQINERILAYGIDPVNVKCEIIIDGNVNNKILLGSMNNNIEQFLVNQTIQGHYFTFRIRGATNTERFTFQGLECPSVSLIDYAE